MSSYRTYFQTSAKPARGWKDMQAHARQGAVTVEFALSAVVLFLFLFAGIEFARVNVIRNSIENAVYEGAREGIVPGASVVECEAAAQEVLDIIGLVGTTITVEPSPIQPDSDAVTVSISAPLNSTNGYFTPQFYLGRTLTSTITLKRERRF